MRTGPISLTDLCGVFAVPPLCRKNDSLRSLDFDQNDQLVRHITTGGITRLLYGGNAFLYHITLDEYAQLAEWLANLPDDLWVIPSVGPSYGRAIDQAKVIRRYSFPCVMVLPCNDPRDPGGLERGLREIAKVAGAPLVVYLKDERNFGADREAGLDAVARLVGDGTCVWIKYAVVRADPNQDAYLEGLLKRVDRRRVISGMGERPVVVHMRDWELPGFTTGSGCLAPRACSSLMDAIVSGDFSRAERLRARFMPLEDLRDRWGPAKVLHHATALAGVADTGPIPPFLSPLDPEQLEQLAPIASALVEERM
jgi:dihydrodipicolinate synthase/N-acetylneuraminate lyase